MRNLFISLQCCSATESDTSPTNSSSHTELSCPGRLLSAQLQQPSRKGHQQRAGQNSARRVRRGTGRAHRAARASRGPSCPASRNPDHQLLPSNTTVCRQVACWEAAGTGAGAPCRKTTTIKHGKQCACGGPAARCALSWVPPASAGPGTQNLTLGGQACRPRQQRRPQGVRPPPGVAGHRGLAAAAAAAAAAAQQQQRARTESGCVFAPQAERSVVQQTPARLVQRVSPGRTIEAAGRELA